MKTALVIIGAVFLAVLIAAWLILPVKDGDKL